MTSNATNRIAESEARRAADQGASAQVAVSSFLIKEGENPLKGIISDEAFADMRPFINKMIKNPNDLQSPDREKVYRKVFRDFDVADGNPDGIIAKPIMLKKLAAASKFVDLPKDIASKIPEAGISVDAAMELFGFRPMPLKLPTGTGAPKPNQPSPVTMEPSAPHGLPLTAAERKRESDRCGKALFCDR